MCITFSKTFDNKGNILTGLSFVLSVGFFFLWTGTMSDKFKESGNFPFFLFFNTVCKKMKGKITFFQDFQWEFSPAALFEDKSLIMSFTSSSETGLTENFPVSLRLRLIFVILGWQRKLPIILSTLS